MILVDANILMYAAGREHPNKEPSVRLLEAIANGLTDAALDAEVLQEIFHRYRSLGRWDEGRQVFDAARQIFTVVLPVDVQTMDRARLLLDQYPGMVARDAVHASVVLQHRLAGLCSYDRDFDQVDDILRLEPDTAIKLGQSGTS